MADKKGRAREGSFKYTPEGLRKRTNQMKSDLAAGRVKPREAVVPTPGSLAARLAAIRAGTAAGTAAKAAPAAGAKSSPWVASAKAGNLPPKALMGGTPGLDVRRQKPKRMTKIDKPAPAPKPKPKVREGASSSRVREGASSNTFRPKAARARKRVI